MAANTSTKTSFVYLRALHSIIGESIDDIERVYRQASVDGHTGKLDFPDPDKPLNASSPAERLVSHTDVVEAIKRIVAATGQLAASVQIPTYAVVETALAVSRRFLFS